MRLAYSSNAYMRYSVFEAIERISALGYEGMELMADVPHAWPAAMTERQCDEIRRHLGNQGLALSNVNAFMMNAVQDFWHPSWIEPDLDFRRRRVLHTRDALRMARRLGAQCITTEPGGPLDQDVSRGTALDRFVEGLNEVLPVAQEEGVSLLVEPEPGLLIENSGQFLDLAGRIDSPAFGLNFDIGHFYCVGESLPDSIRKLAPWIRHFHVEDIAAGRVHEHLIPGRGAIEFAEVFAAIRAMEYTGWITLELYPYLDDPDGAGREARRFLEPFLSPCVSR